MTFKDRFLRGECKLEAIEDWVQLWHEGVPSGQSLSQFLGLTDEENQVWLMEGSEGLARLLLKDVQVRYRAVYLTWDELADQLQSLVRQRLSLKCSISIKRVDFYFWEMQIKLPSDADETLSAKICERLGLQGVEPDHFVDFDSVDNDQLLCLLEKLTGHEVSSSHADDYGVWIICKEYQASSQEYAERLLADCEKRLHREIRNRHYPLVDQDTACHQLFGFKEALKVLGIIPAEQWIVNPNHFSNSTSCENDRTDQPAADTRLPSADAVQRARQCLSDNGIAADETETVIQALGYILFDADIVRDLPNTDEAGV